MQNLDRQVLEKTCQWLESGGDVWLCTVLSTFGSSPREPGSMFAVDANGGCVGSLSGGCVEDDFLLRVHTGEFDKTVQRICYGQGSRESRVQLPCGGTLAVLVEKLSANVETVSHIKGLLVALKGQRTLCRQVDLMSGQLSLTEVADLSSVVDEREGVITIRVGPVVRLIIAGASTVAEFCAQFAQSLNYEVLVCDPRPDVVGRYVFNGCTIINELPSLFIARAGSCHKATAVVAVTHDPRIDDLALIEAVETDAFYIGVMGSKRTSEARAERLQRIAQLTDMQLQRIHMPIGLAIGSKTPAEIALAIMADVVRVLRGGGENEL